MALVGRGLAGTEAWSLPSVTENADEELLKYSFVTFEGADVQEAARDVKGKTQREKG